MQGIDTVFKTHTELTLVMCKSKSLLKTTKCNKSYYILEERNKIMDFNQYLLKLFLKKQISEW